MTNKELDKWIAENLMGWNKDYLIKNKHNVPKYTTDPDCAMEVLKKCGDASKILCIDRQSQTRWKIHNNEVSVVAPTCELAICLFAKKLFSK